MKTLFLVVILGLVACDKQTPQTPEQVEVVEPVEQPTKPAGLTVVQEEAEAEVEVFPLEHGSLMLKSGEIVVAVDVVTQALDAAKWEGPKADVVFVTHIHGDHLDPAAIARVAKEGAVIVMAQAAAEQVGEAISSPTIMANGDHLDFLEGALKAEAIPMYNLVRKRDSGEFYHVKGQGNGYVLTLGGKRIYVSGDTECTPEMKGLKDIDMAFVCMNLPFTMVPEEAAECVREFKPKTLFPYHFRGQDPTVLADLLKDVPEVQIELLNWYPNGQ